MFFVFDIIFQGDQYTNVLPNFIDRIPNGSDDILATQTQFKSVLNTFVGQVPLKRLIFSALHVHFRGFFPFGKDRKDNVS